jgi:hypothetical protein
MKSIRKPPPLRRSFPEPHPAWAARRREKKQRAFEAEPRLAELERRLLDLGGHTVLLVTGQPYVEQILERGRCMPGARSLYWRGAPSECHGNAATLYVRSQGAVRIASGYALSEDGRWYQHSWGINLADGRVIETTVRRVRYFGFILRDDDESVEFFLRNVDPGQFSPEETAAIGAFICGRSDELMAKFREAPTAA